MKMTPSDFFYIFVEGNYNDFVERENSIRRAFNAVVPAFHLADHYYKYCKCHDPNKIRRYQNRKNYLRYLSAKNNYFQDIQSIANAYKHLYQRNLNAPHVTVSSAGTIETIENSNVEIEGEPQKYVVYKNIKTNRKRRLSVALKNVIKMWKKELANIP